MKFWCWWGAEEWKCFRWLIPNETQTTPCDLLWDWIPFHLKTLLHLPESDSWHLRSTERDRPCETLSDRCRSGSLRQTQPESRDITVKPPLHQLLRRRHITVSKPIAFIWTVRGSYRWSQVESGELALLHIGGSLVHFQVKRAVTLEEAALICLSNHLRQVFFFFSSLKATI